MSASFQSTEFIEAERIAYYGDDAIALAKAHIEESAIRHVINTNDLTHPHAIKLEWNQRELMIPRGIELRCNLLVSRVQVINTRFYAPYETRKASNAVPVTPRPKPTLTQWFFSSSLEYFDYPQVT